MARKWPNCADPGTNPCGVHRLLASVWRCRRPMGRWSNLESQAVPPGVTAAPTSRSRSRWRGPLTQWPSKQRSRSARAPLPVTCGQCCWLGFYEAFPLACSRCGESVRIIAFITDSPSINRILDYLGQPATHLPAAHPAGRTSMRPNMSSPAGELVGAFPRLFVPTGRGTLIDARVRVPRYRHRPPRLPLSPLPEPSPEPLANH